MEKAQMFKTHDNLGDEGDSSSLFPTGKTAQERGLPYVPKRYIVPTSQRPISSPEIADDLPVIDLTGLRQGPEERARVIESIKDACRHFGFFQVVNHGICQSILDDALASAFEFFELPTPEKMKFMSNDVHEPVRYCSSLKDGVDKVQFWRVFLKHYAHPLEDWIKHWPTNPPSYREKMGKYCREVRKLGLGLMVAIGESLGLCPNELSSRLEPGMQVMAVNCYPPCPEPDRALGLPPHSDYSCLTVLLQSAPGLEIADPATGSWRPVPHRPGVLQVHVGDHFEALSNGAYTSLLHRATLSRGATRVSLASLFSMAMEEKVGPAPELVGAGENPAAGRYRESSFKDFLDFLAENDLAQGKSFISTLKILDEDDDHDHDLC